EAALRVRVVPARVRLPPVPLVRLIVEAPAPRVMAPMLSVVATALLPTTDRVPPLSVVATLRRALLLAAVLSRSTVPPWLMVTAEASAPFAPLSVRVPPLTTVAPV